MSFRLVLLVLTALFAIVASPAALAADGFEGKIVYRITYEEVPAELQGMEAMLPDEMRLYIDKTKVRMEQSVMGGSQIVILDTATGQGSVLMDILGQKIRVDTNVNDQPQPPAPTVEHLAGDRTVAGHACKQARLTSSDGTVTTVWYTDKLPAIHQDFKSLDGFPLAYSTAQQGMKVRIEATDVAKGPVDDHLFVPPEGYHVMTEEDMKQMMDGTP